MIVKGKAKVKRKASKAKDDEALKKTRKTIPKTIRQTTSLPEIVEDTTIIRSYPKGTKNMKTTTLVLDDVDIDVEDDVMPRRRISEPTKSSPRLATPPPKYHRTSSIGSSNRGRKERGEKSRSPKTLWKDTLSSSMHTTQTRRRREQDLMSASEPSHQMSRRGENPLSVSESTHNDRRRRDQDMLSSSHGRTRRRQGRISLVT